MTINYDTMTEAQLRRFIRSLRPHELAEFRKQLMADTAQLLNSTQREARINERKRVHDEAKAFPHSKVYKSATCNGEEFGRSFRKSPKPQQFNPKGLHAITPVWTDLPTTD